MRRRVLAFVVFGVAAWLAVPQTATAGHGRRGGCGGGMSGDCGGCATSYTVSYVDKKVTCYKMETETKDVKVVVNEWVDSKEDYKYMECVPVVTKQKVTMQEMRTKEEAYKYTAMEMTQVKQLVKVCEWKQVTKDVEVTTFDCVPVVTKQKRVVCETVCVPVQVTRTITPPAPCASGSGGHGLFGRCCAKKRGCDDPCASPCPAPPPCPVTITCTVMQKQVVRKEIEVDVRTMTCVPKKTIQKCVQNVPNWVEKEVLVYKCVPVEKEGKRMVNFCVPVEKEVDVHATKMVEKIGTRIVKKCVPVEKTVKQTFCKQVPYETTIKVPVYTPCPAPAPAPCAAPCPTPCASTGMSGGCGGHARGGLFGRCCH